MNSHKDYQQNIKDITDDFIGQSSGSNKRSVKKKSQQTQVIVEQISKMYFQEIHDNEIISMKKKSNDQLKQKYSTY